LILILFLSAGHSSSASVTLYILLLFVGLLVPLTFAEDGGFLLAASISNNSFTSTSIDFLLATTSETAYYYYISLSIQNHTFPVFASMWAVFSVVLFTAKSFTGIVNFDSFFKGNVLNWLNCSISSFSFSLKLVISSFSWRFSSSSFLINRVFSSYFCLYVSISLLWVAWILFIY